MKVQIFRFFTARDKIYRISHVIFQTKSEFLDHCSVSWEITLLHILAGILYAIDKSSTSKCKFSDLLLLALKFTKFVMFFLKPRASCSSNFASHSRVIRDKSSVLFHAKLYMLLTRGTHQVQIFRLSTIRMKINQIPCHFSIYKSVFS